MTEEMRRLTPISELPDQDEQGRSPFDVVLDEYRGRSRSEYEEGRQQGIRDAVRWLQADYPYGDMPEWRQSAVDWVEDRAREERVAAREQFEVIYRCPAHPDRPVPAPA